MPMDAQRLTDTFTTTGVGASGSKTSSAQPFRYYTLVVKATGTVTSWTVLLEGSLDGTNWTTLVTHTNAAPGDGLAIFETTAPQPVTYVRLRCSAITLGAGTNVVATALALPA